MNKVYYLTIIILITIAVATQPIFAQEAPQKLYNLTASGFVMTPQNPAVNEPVKIKVTVINNSNVGLITSQGINDFSYKFDNFVLTKLSYDIPTYDNMIPAGGVVNYYFEGKFTATGVMGINFVADDKNQLEELKLNDLGFTTSAENDNQINSSLNIVPSDFDLSIDSLSLAYNKLVDSLVKITINVKNSGKASLIDFSGLENPKVSYTTLPGLAISNSTHNDFPTIDKPLEPGQIFSYTYEGKADKTGEVSFNFKINDTKLLKETDNSNNSTTTKLFFYGTQAEADDFKISNFTVSPISSTSLMVNWQTDPSVTINRVFYKAPNFEWSTLDSSISGNKQSVTLVDLMPNIEYSVQGYSKNNSVEKYSELKLIRTPVNDDFLILPTVSTTTEAIKQVDDSKDSAKANLEQKKIPVVIVPKNVVVPKTTQKVFDKKTIYVFSKTLKVGSKNNEVLQLQLRLQSEKFLTVQKEKPNGYFGAGTAKALKAYQKKNKIKQTGMLDQVTRNKLNKK